ncbi:hypothetical protein [Streptomyces sp. DSM 118148]|uniref:hypothetical protein n=1 Tax=Streptomyces sp. DSM 118148 TaxID=3448667 RepID=UPI004040107D
MARNTGTTDRVARFGSDLYTLGDEARRSELVDLYSRVLTKAEAPGELPAREVWETWRPGSARGPLFGGLLNRLVLLQATPFAPAPERFDGAVLFWEELHRPVSRIWNDLQTLRLSGVLGRIAGMVVGIPTEVTPHEGGGDRADLRDVVLDVLGQRDIPVLGRLRPHLAEPAAAPRRPRARGRGQPDAVPARAGGLGGLSSPRRPGGEPSAAPSAVTPPDRGAHSPGGSASGREHALHGGHDRGLDPAVDPRTADRTP